MGQIPLADYGTVKKTQLQSTRSAGAESAPYRALESVGAALRTTASELKGYAERRQNLSDNAGLSRIKLQLIEAEKQVARETSPEFDTETGELVRQAPAWTEHDQIANKVWSGQKYDEALAGLSPEARQQALSMIDEASQKSMIGVNANAQKIAIQEDNAAIMATAQHLARNGKWEEAMEEIDKYHGSPEKKQAMQNQIYEEGAFAEVARDMEEITMPGVYDDPVGELEEFQRQLNEKDKDGNYTQYKRLSDGGRDTLKRNVQATIKREQRREILTVDRALKAAKDGKLTDSEIDDLQIDPDVKEGLRKYNSQTAEAEMFSEGDAKLIEQKLGAYAATTLLLGVEIEASAEAFEELLKEINNAKLNNETKYRYFSQALDLKAKELSTGEEAVPDGWLWGTWERRGQRDVSTQEIGMRNRLMVLYREEAKGRNGAERMGPLMLRHEEAIRGYFDMPEDVRPDAREFFQGLKDQISMAVADQANQNDVDALLF
jgi:hypothetical protein